MLAATLRYWVVSVHYYMIQDFSEQLVVIQLLCKFTVLTEQKFIIVFTKACFERYPETPSHHVSLRPILIFTFHPPEILQFKFSNQNFNVFHVLHSPHIWSYLF
jgi:hypothetical protein